MAEEFYISPNIKCEKRYNQVFLIFERENSEKKRKKVDELTLKDFIEIIKDTIDGWYFLPLKALLKLNSTDRFFKGIVILQSIIPLVELYGQLYYIKSSRNKSNEIFKEALSKLFLIEHHADEILFKEKKGEETHQKVNDKNDKNKIDKITYLVYNIIRNGLCHNAFFKLGAKFSFDYQYPLKIKMGNYKKFEEFLNFEGKPTDFLKKEGKGVSKINDGNEQIKFLWKLLQFTIEINPQKFMEILEREFNIFFVKLSNNGDNEIREKIKKHILTLHGKIQYCTFLGEERTQ